ncbi:MAG: decaprenyl-phosphate phosphoribosyltransferase [Gemmatimonadetes bacterium]|nr:decaprenyl-phosphate phosphoribosyltransferase [Gemmatimonadota bacterium]
MERAGHEGALAGGAAMPPLSGAARGSPADWARLLRPRQWVKNTFVLAPLLFSGSIADPARIAAAGAAFLLFCLLASGIYCWNDVADREADRAHPVKRDRPIASGRIAARAAIFAGVVLVGVALAGGWALDAQLGLVFLLYLGLNVLYTRALKAMVILDVFSIATFFVLRLLAGCAAIDVVPSVWLLLCGGLFSLYIGFAKRRHELALMGEDGATHRSVLAHYDVPLLDQMSVILLSVTVVSYIMYTLTSETAALAGGEALSYSTVFVLYGVFRYLYLVHGSGKGGDPTETLLTDRALLIDVGLWVAYCGWALYRPF